MSGMPPRCDRKAVERFNYTGLAPEFFPLAKPARRALLTNGIRTPADLARRTLEEVSEFHGIGPSAVLVLRRALRKHGLRFNS